MLLEDFEKNAGHILPPPTSVDRNAKEFKCQNHSLRPGRLSVKCIKASDIQRTGQRYAIEKTILNPSLRLTLGFGSAKAKQATSRTHQDTGSNPSFEDEIIWFDVQNPRELFSQDGNGITMKIELLNKNLLRYDVLGAVEISVNRFFGSYVAQIERFPIKLVGDNSSMHASISLEIDFAPVREGLLAVSLLKYENASHHEAVGMHIDLHLGSETKKSDSMEAWTKKKVMYIMVDKKNWFEDLGFHLYMRNGGDSVLRGKHTMQLLPLISDQYDDDDVGSEGGLERSLCFSSSTKDGTEISAGRAIVTLNFMQAGYLTMKNIRGSSFLKPHILTDAGLQLILKSQGIASSVEGKSNILRYEFPGKDIIWSDKLILPVVDNHILSIELYQHNASGIGQNLIGSTEISMLPVYKYGTHSTSVKLQGVNEVNEETTCGTMTFTLEFEGGGLSYPKLHHSSTIVIQKENGEKPSSNESSSPIAQEIIQRSKDTAVSASEVFSDDEIKSAFQFLDLDKNSHIGAAELRHALICMGELVTDEEIDAMISILDTNGDGQVNFQQFRGMGRSPNFGYESISTVDDVIDDRVANNGKPKFGVDPPNDAYETKRRTFSTFVANNKIKRETLDKFRTFLGQKRNAFLSVVDTDAEDTNNNGAEEDVLNPSTSNSIWEIDHPTLCRCLAVERTGESKQVFDLLLAPNKTLGASGRKAANTDTDAYTDATKEHHTQQNIDTRSLLLGLMNFTTPTYSTHEKCQIVLELYDEKKEGFLTVGDLRKVLAANHMRSEASVEKKAQTMTRFIGNGNLNQGQGQGRLTLEDLLDAASKFPNLLFPKHTQ